MKITTKYAIAYVDSKGVEHKKPEHGTFTNHNRAKGKAKKLNTVRRMIGLGKYIVVQL